MVNSENKRLRRLAADIRIKSLECMAAAGGGHVGGAMSICDVLAVLYGKVMKYDPKNPRWEGRDRLVVSKGHSGPAVYAALALEGFFPMEWLGTLNKGGTDLPSHCDRVKTPGIDMSTGSLGQGVSVACGMAAALRKKGSASRVYTILGDGELQEGQVWEAFQFLAHQKLDNITVYIDNNKRQLDGLLEEVCNPFDLQKKVEGFGLKCATVKGYDVDEILKATEESMSEDGPRVIILDTIKGIGCSFAEETEANHHMAFTKEDAAEAADEINRRFEAGIVGKEEIYE